MIQRTNLPKNKTKGKIIKELLFDITEFTSVDLKAVMVT